MHFMQVLAIAIVLIGLLIILLLLAR